MDRAEPRSEDVEMAEATSVQPEPPATLEAYIQQVQQRRRLFEPSRAARETAKGYTIDPSGAAPHSAHIHAMAMVQDASILLSGGSDGYVRWYDLYASMNGKNMLTQNLRSSFVEGVAKGGVLTTWWGNAHLAPGEPLTRADAPLSPVHSLACERNALWGVSGGESGQINLYTLRHDPGQLRHVFRKHTAAVSALALSDSETELLSGGWDRGVYQWDLHTGQMVRSYDGHAGQVSSIQFRPMHAPSAPVPEVVIRPGAADGAEGASPLEVELEAELAHSLEADAPTSDAAPGEEHDAVLDSEREGDDAGENDNDSLFGEQDESMAEPHVDGSGESVDADGDSDADADGEADLFDGDDTKPEGEESDDAPLSQVTAPAKAGAPSLALPGQQRPETIKKEAPKEAPPAPHVSRFSSDVLLTSTLSGQVLLWDRRVDNKAKPGVRALPLPPHTPPWCTSVCWNHAGDRIYVGRRNETVDEWDVRMLPDVDAERGTGARSSSAKAPQLLQSLRLPRGSGPVSAVSMMPNDRHIVCASFDNVRLWDTQPGPGTEVPFKIVAGHHGGTISQILVDDRAQFLLTSSGDRGWFSSSTETLLMHEIVVL
ncbi:Transcription factor spt8 [Malassezia obtusa]|uniref:Transcription factor spt8 n=1 Tax=Malassezia obtusa TaxID=76774 RepID=A0AAF0E013_9BASI|nr:Transcription factor spt8 [Malassezia obtusa]